MILVGLLFLHPFSSQPTQASVVSAQSKGNHGKQIHRERKDRGINNQKKIENHKQSHARHITSQISKTNSFQDQNKGKSMLTSL